jgi:hypothetical protein
MLFHHNPKENNLFPSKFFLRLLSLQKENQKGTIFVVATAMGILVIGAAGLAIANASQNKTNTTSDEQTKQAIAVAEAGVTRMQDLFKQEPRLAMVTDHTKWTEVLNAGTGDTLNNKLSQVAGIKNLSNNTNCPNVSTGSLTPTQIKSKLEGEVIKVLSTNNNISSNDTWVNLGGSNDSSKGKYKLVSYTRNNTTQTGTLTIQGITEANNEAKSQIKVEFDAKIQPSSNQTQINSHPPGLWAQDFGAMNAPIAANVLDSSECQTKGTNALNPTTLVTNTPLFSPLTGNGNYLKKAISFPPLPNNGVYTVPTIPTENVINSSKIPSSLPEIGDKATDGTVYNNGQNNQGKTYVYKFSSGIPVGNSTLTLGKTGKENIVIYSEDDITLNGNGKITPYKNGNDITKVKFYVNGNLNLSGNGQSSNAVSDYQVYVYGTRNITINGNSYFTAFIFAPQSTITLNGAGNSSDILSGALWVKSYNSNGNHSTFKQTISNTDIANLDINPTELKATYTIGNIKNWQREETK